MRAVGTIAGAIAALVVIVGIGAILYYGYTTRPGWVGVSGKKFWDYLDLLIVPVAIAIGVAVINWMQSRRERQAEELQRDREREMEDLQRRRELEVQRERAIDTALETYLDKIETMLYERAVLDEVPEFLRHRGLLQVIRARTLTLLSDRMEVARGPLCGS